MILRRKLSSSEVAIVQPIVPLYRRAFFAGLNQERHVAVYVYSVSADGTRENLAPSDPTTFRLANLRVGKAVLMNFLPLLLGPHKTVVLCAEMKQLSNWAVLLLGRFFGKKVILWGHGLDARQYDKQAHHISWIIRLMYRIADGAWFYTENEQRLWRSWIPGLKSVALGNTVDVPSANKTYSEADKRRIRKKYGIHTQINFIYCARFRGPERRIDLLIQLIERLNPSRFGFIIIGDGASKPDFSRYPNIYDFGAVYDPQKKSELFAVADAYFLPASCGLSAVEAMAYGKGVLTLRRSETIPQGVEYGYIKQSVNGLIFDTLDEVVEYVGGADARELQVLGASAKAFYREHLQISDMIANAVAGIRKVERM